MDNPSLTSELIHVFQLMDPECQKLHESNPKHYVKRKIGTFELLTVTPTKGRNSTDDNHNNWKIYLPDSLVDRTLRWYHLLLGNCGTTRLYETINARFYAPRLSQRCREYQCPDEYHQFKQQGQGYGELPPREAQLTPWNEVCVDLIGPWKILLQDGTSPAVLSLTGF